MSARQIVADWLMIQASDKLLEIQAHKARFPQADVMPDQEIAREYALTAQHLRTGVWISREDAETLLQIVGGLLNMAKGMEQDGFAVKRLREKYEHLQEALK